MACFIGVDISRIATKKVLMVETGRALSVAVSDQTV